MAKRWQTPRRCEICSSGHITELMWAQAWGKDLNGNVQIKLDCLRCGYHQVATWDGHGESIEGEKL